MATKPIKFLELHYTMTQFLITKNILGYLKDNNCAAHSVGSDIFYAVIHPVQMFQAGAVKVKHDLLLVVLQVNQSKTIKIHAIKDDGSAVWHLEFFVRNALW